MHDFGDDQPKDNPWQDDKLGFAPFAKRVFNVVVNMKVPNGYVIGIHGQWGSGKSTILNFVDAYLRKHNEETDDEGARIKRVDFKPWNVSGHQDLIVAFFKVLSEEMGPPDSRFQRWYKGLFRGLVGTTDQLVDAAAAVALTVDPSGGSASGFAGNLAKKSVNSLLGKFLEDPSLQTAYMNLRNQLEKSGKRFLITIDDIDRLTPTEVRDIMQMVKTVGRLPNVIYILAYDREIVWNALDGTIDRQGPHYAEKIVQQELELPLPSRNALLSILDGEISFLTGPGEDSTRWQYIVRDGVQRWIKHPRDVLRLSNAVKFAWPALEGEFDPQDLLAIEGMRLFDPIAFDWVRGNRDFLFNDGRFFMANDEARKAVVATLLKRLPEGTGEPVTRLLATLFPGHGKWFERENFVSETNAEAHDRRGLSHEAAFDSYFQLHPSGDAIPNATLTDLFKLDNSQDIYELILPYVTRLTSRGRLMAGGMLADIRSRLASANPPLPTQALLDALIRAGEEFTAEPYTAEIGTLRAPSQYMFLIRDMLRIWGVDEAPVRLKEAFANGHASGLAIIYHQRGRDLAVFPSDTQRPDIITKEEFDELGELLLPKIQAAAADGSLLNAVEYFYVVVAWARLDGPAAPRAWLSQNFDKAKFVTKVAADLVSTSISSTGRSYALRKAPDETVYDLDALLPQAKKHLAEAELDADDKKKLTALVSGIERMRAGLPLKQLMDLDDD